MTDLTGAIWRKSTRSGGNGGECVEVATNLPGIVAVRDSKDRFGAPLTFPPAAWGEFVKQINSGSFVDGGRAQQRG
ncbi:DUF397 domain-containing protein [Micromonospora soli]|uniref:DUF397 domain-containing protein n=1 Tax=Micromonospora sp. NBRC 110009 TaxID=3061627 RepID=UPI002671B664|nr:DUF397 domain-containing protein [Micromonospora sp. NBRC 110009]WKT97627.1 DUF397 domain-containing protein [Micromonospora sp. NBRC 110009]